jgi:hypothetical protein
LSLQSSCVGNLIPEFIFDEFMGWGPSDDIKGFIRRRRETRASMLVLFHHVIPSAML